MLNTGNMVHKYYQLEIYLQNVIMTNNFIGVEKTTKRFLDKLQNNPGPPNLQIIA